MAVHDWLEATSTAAERCPKPVEHCGPIPPVITTETLRVLEGRGELMNENVMKPGEHRRAEFPDGGRLLIHRLQGLDLERADRIDLALSTPEGSPLVRFEDVPFDRDTGEVLAKYIIDHTY